MTAWQPKPGEACWIAYQWNDITECPECGAEAWKGDDCDVCDENRDRRVIPHAILDALKGMVENCCTFKGHLCPMGSSTDYNALRVLEQAGEVRCVVEGDRVTARFEWTEEKP